MSVCLLLFALAIAAAEPAPAPAVIVVVGAEGTQEYGKTFTEQAARWQAAAKAGKANCITIGQEKEGEKSDRDLLQQALADQPKQSPRELYLVLVGHGTFDGKTPRFNLRGPDFTAAELAGWLSGFERPLAVANCASCSGAFLQPLAAEGRVVIAATKSGFEHNFARFGEHLSKSIADPAADFDKDGQTSLLEAYLSASRQTADFYATQARLATEHSLLDDTGDGKGTPADWFRGVRAVRNAKDAASLDGPRAHQFCLVPGPEEQGLPLPAVKRRNEIELAIVRLRVQKSSLPEADYYDQLEKLLVELARLYQDVDKEPEPPKKEGAAVQPAASQSNAQFLVDVKQIQDEMYAEYARQRDDVVVQLAAAKSSTEEQRIKQAQAEGAKGIYATDSPPMKKLWDVLRPHVAEDAAVEPLVWWLEKGGSFSDVQATAEILIRHHVAHSRTFELAVSESQSGSADPWVESLCRAILSADVSNERKAVVNFCLAVWLANATEFLNGQASRAAADVTYKPGAPAAALLTALRDRDPAKLEAEAIQRFEEIIEAKPKAGIGDKPLADLAKSQLFEFVHLRVGKPAPESEGDDLDGLEFKLSDYRGKVVLVTFWATWCGPCMALAAHERELLERMQGKPFAIVGVNADETTEEAKTAIADGKITWRSFWNGGRQGPLSRAWNVTSWPTTYLLDGNGVIRAKQVRYKSLDEAVDKLVAETESAGK